jgi:hypothetical protein
MYKGPRAGPTVHLKCTLNRSGFTRVPYEISFNFLLAADANHYSLAFVQYH